MKHTTAIAAALLLSTLPPTPARADLVARLESGSPGLPSVVAFPGNFAHLPVGIGLQHLGSASHPGGGVGLSVPAGFSGGHAWPQQMGPALTDGLDQVIEARYNSPLGDTLSISRLESEWFAPIGEPDLAGHDIVEIRMTISSLVLTYLPGPDVTEIHATYAYEFHTIPAPPAAAALLALAAAPLLRRRPR